MKPQTPANKFTPGPWTIDVHDFESGWAYTIQEELDLYEKANESDGDELMDQANDVHAANQALIAAAPALVAALEAILDLPCDDSGERIIPAGFLDDARAALVAAKPE